MARPPSRGIGSRWTFRGPGRSTIPTRRANCRTGTVRPKEEIKATVNAIRLAFIRTPISALRKHPLEDRLHVRAVPVLVIPIDGALQSFTERHLGLPARQFLRE